MWGVTVKILALFGVSVLVGLLVLFTPDPACATQNGCGFKPLKPLVPLGCKDLVARCQCERDADGFMQCRWVWDCVPDD